MRRRLLTFVLTATVVTGAATRAAAQTPPSHHHRLSGSNLMAGLSIVHDTHTSGLNPTGWVAAAHLPIAKRLGLVGEMGGNYGTMRIDDVPFNFRTHAFLGGLRYAAERRGHMLPFGQVLAGAACYCGSTIGISTKSTAFALQPGVGIDLPLMNHVSLRLQTDVRTIFGADKTFYQVRFAGGISVGLNRDR